MPINSSAAAELDPSETARHAGLRYVGDDVAGITRVPDDNGGFRYVDAAGRGVRDERTLSRIRSLDIPPAWTDVWISPWENGHIEATGRDAKRRKQYRYHPRAGRHELHPLGPEEEAAVLALLQERLQTARPATGRNSRNRHRK